METPEPERGSGNESYYVTGERGVTGFSGRVQIGTADVFVCLNPSNKMPQTVGFKN